MLLSEVIIDETNATADEIIFIRHSNGDINNLEKHGGDIKEYTAVQPTNTKYDFYHKNKRQIKVVVAIVKNLVHAVYRVDGMEKEGTNYNLTSESYRQHDISLGRKEGPARLFKLIEIESRATGCPVLGWEGSRTRTPVQRSNGGFFYKLQVVLDNR